MKAALLVTALLVPAGVAKISHLGAAETTHWPTSTPTESPSTSPSMLPSSARPSHFPTHPPTHDPTTWEPTLHPTSSPPSHPPSEKPTHSPTHDPSSKPTYSVQPSTFPTEFHGPEGSQWGYGCSYVCEGNLEGVKDLFSGFEEYVYATLNASFISTKAELKDIIADASAMLVAKVQAKAAALSHQHARLDATHRVLVDLLGGDGSGDALDALDADASVQPGGGVSGAVRAMEVSTEESLVVTSSKDVHIAPGVQWATFGLQVGLALVAGIVLESSRIRQADAPSKGQQQARKAVDVR